MNYNRVSFKVILNQLFIELVNNGWINVIIIKRMNEEVSYVRIVLV